MPGLTRLCFFLACLLFFICTACVTFAQSRILIGTVTDSLGNPLERANVMARVQQGNEGVKFAMADHLGRYRLELLPATTYDISVTYIGYQQQNFVLLAEEKDKERHDFKLIRSDEVLDEIVIKYDYSPVEIKKDTIIFHVDAFTSGNERRLKEVLSKLPGVEVDDNGRVRFQGNTVSTTLVENKVFFGGGSKLAVENLPADAVEKIEMISHFSEVDFMKDILSSDELAMNVKLKADKKDLLFGDLEAAAGPQAHHLGHAALFRFTPENSISFIADINNIGESVFTTDDVMRFQGGVSRYLSNTRRPSFISLNQFANNNQDVVDSRSRFAAINWDRDLNKKVNLTGFGIFSNQVTQSRTDELIQYLTNQDVTEEVRLMEQDSDDLMGLANVKLEYSPTRYQKWYYNGQLQVSRRDMGSMLTSTTNIHNSLFESGVDDKVFSIRQYIEWHRSYRANHTTTLVINHTLENNRPRTVWINDRVFLTGLLPMIDDDTYQVQHIQRQRGHAIDALFKHYWGWGRYGQLTTNLGNTYTDAFVQTADRQLLTDGEINDFESVGFGNTVNYGLNDAYMGLEYRFELGKLSNTATLTGHWYHLAVTQLSGQRTRSIFMLEPSWLSEYEFNTNEKLYLNYSLRNSFPRVGQLNDRFSLTTYNAVASGNAMLESQRYHTTFLRYHKFGAFAGTNVSSTISFTRRTRSIRDEFVFEGINQYRMPVMTDNPETNVSAFVNYEKNVWLLKASFSAQVGWFNYTQTVNELLSNNTRTNQSYRVGLRTTGKKWPNVHVRYTKGFNRFRGNSHTRFATDRIMVNIDYRFLPAWVFDAQYDYFLNNNITTSNTYTYRIANAALDYQRPNSAWGFRLTANNVLNNQQKNNNRISDYLISEQTTFVLPRIFLLGVRYKL